MECEVTQHQVEVVSWTGHCHQVDLASQEVECEVTGHQVVECVTPEVAGVECKLIVV